MNPHRQTLKICFQIIFLLLLALSSLQASEPSYNGKPLSEWLLILKERHAFEMIDEADAQAAIRQIGTNGIPIMIDLLNVYDERSAKKVSGLSP
jgi:ABC-type oligopeptide transport system substrate-binding subunit